MSLEGPFPLDSVEVAAAAESIKSALGISGSTGTNTGDETTESVLGLLQGAEADPTKIGAEHLPDEIPDTLFGLVDTSALTLENNFVGLDAGGNLVRHNNTDLGGNRFDGKVLRGAGRISGALTNANAVGGIPAATTGQVLILAETTIHAGENVDASAWMLSGQIRIQSTLSNWTGAITPRVGIYLVGGDGVPASQASVNRGYNVAFDAAAELSIIDFSELMTMSVATAVSFNPGSRAGGSIVRNITSGTISTVVTNLATGSGIANTRSVVSGEIKVRLFVGLDKDSAGADTGGFLNCHAECRLDRVS